MNAILNDPGARPGPGGSRLALEQATFALRAGDPFEARRALQARLLEKPDDGEALDKLAEMAIEEGRIDEATMLLRRAAADPASRRQIAFIRHLRAYAGSEAALSEVEALPHSIREQRETRMLEASLLGMLGKHDRQIAIHDSLTTDFPGDGALWLGLANALKTVGRTADAVAAVRRAIAIEPTRGEAYWTLANFKSFRFTDRDVSAMRKQLRGKRGDTDRLLFDFALGKALEDRRLFARSFRHYAAGNELCRAGLRPEQMRVTGFVDLALATFDRALFDRHRGAGCTARDPIFVVGLHRSGSTLIEQILASHPMIEGASELPVMQGLFARIARTAASRGRSPFEEIARLEPAAFERIGAEYLESTRAFRRTERPLFVDKLPANWLNVGLIRLALPNATIIDARRHPLACGFSNFKQHYASGVTFSYSLRSIGYFYRDYLRLMEHFDEIQPGKILHVVNERLIENPEREIRRMLDRIGVAFDGACLESHRNARAVPTPSAEQVRRPINRDGVDAWRSYEPWLGPLKDALGPALDRWRPPDA